ncbi:sensor histidine kinase [Actinomyces sp.]|uniref:sensor histidine kinase n=1 Tax=Actinomyces sp. TaxID=29317 RepID=UPI0026DD98AF|nr:ATP-binding protein [Actinomyces sp.]MDO4901218.1 ATP-binding protein [Actinomyces sp.]
MGEGKVIAEAALAPTVRLLSDIRLVLLLLMAAVCRFDWAVFLTVACAVPCSFILLFRWGRTTRRVVAGVYFVAWDGIAALVLLIIGFQHAGTSAALALGYLQVSALLMGMVAGDRALAAWCALVVVGVFELIQYAPDLSAMMIVAAGAALVLALLGRRQTQQVGRVEVMAADAAEARSRQSAAEERLVLARDLHDTVAKSAAGVRMLAEALSADLRRQESEYARDASNLFDAADALSAEARSVLDELRSAPAGDLRGQLREDAETWASRVGTDVSVDVSGEEMVADAELKWQVQRVLGELLANVEKHAKATVVSVRIEGEDTLQLTVEDNGVGLPRRILEDQSNLRGSGHYGLCGVRERLAAIGGRLTLTATPDGGTRAMAQIPRAISSNEKSSLTTARMTV